MATIAALTRKNNLVVIAAWGFILLASILPEIIFIEVLGRADLVTWATWGRLVTLAMLAVVSWLWEPLRPLWKYTAILFIFAAGQEVMNGLEETAVWQNGLGRIGDSFAHDYLGVQFWKLGSTIIVLIGLVVLGFRRKDAFLVRGSLMRPSRRSSGWASPSLNPGRALARNGSSSSASAWWSCCPYLARFTWTPSLPPWA